MNDSDASSPVIERPAQRIRLNSNEDSAASAAAVVASAAAPNNVKGPNTSRTRDLPAKQCTGANFFSEPDLDDRQRIRWALRTEAQVRFGKLQLREMNPDEAEMMSSACQSQQQEDVSRDDTLNSEYLIDLYPPSASSMAIALPDNFDQMSKDDQNLLKVFLRDKEKFERTLTPDLMTCRKPDGSFSSLAQLDIELPPSHAMPNFQRTIAAPPNLLVFELILEGYMGYRVSRYHSPDPTMPRAAVMGGAVVAALSAWHDGDVRDLFDSLTLDYPTTYHSVRKSLVKKLNHYFLPASRRAKGEALYHSGDVDIFLQQSPLQGTATKKITRAVAGTNLVQELIRSYAGPPHKDLHKFAESLCESHLKPLFFKNDIVPVYALGRNALSFAYSLAYDPYKYNHYSHQSIYEVEEDDDIWPRATQLIILDDRADLVGALLDFDTSASAFAYDGITVRAAPRAVFSLLTMTQVVTPNVLTEKRNRSRIVKYNKRGHAAYLIDPHCSHPTQCHHDLELRFPYYDPSDKLGRDMFPGVGIRAESKAEWTSRGIHGTWQNYDVKVDAVEDVDYEDRVKTCCRNGDDDTFKICNNTDNAGREYLAGIVGAVLTDLDWFEEARMKSIALFQVKEGHAHTFFAKRHGWSAEEILEVSKIPVDRCYACPRCRYEYAIWLVFSRDALVGSLGVEDLNAAISFAYATEMKGGFGGFTPSFYGCGAFSPLLTRHDARNIIQQLNTLKSQLAAERVKYLVKHLGESGATSEYLPLFSNGFVENSGGYSDRYAYGDELQSLFERVRSANFPLNARAPVGLNPERFVEICARCSSFMVGCEYGEERCLKCSASGEDTVGGEEMN